MEKIRAFIAGILSTSLNRCILEIQGELKKLDLDSKWVEPRNIHITLKFLGSIPLGSIEDIKNILKKVFENEKKIQISLNALGTFPNIKKPRVIWVGLRDKERVLEKLFYSLEESLNSLGFPKEEREFRPHITLGRLRSLKNTRRFINFLKEFEPERKEGFLEDIVLFRSQLHPQGPQYLKLYEINLKDT